MEKQTFIIDLQTESKKGSWFMIEAVIGFKHNVKNADVLTYVARFIEDNYNGSTMLDTLQIEAATEQLFYELTAILGPKYSLEYIKVRENSKRSSYIYLNDIDYKTLVKNVSIAHNLKRIKEWKLKNQ